MSTRLHANGYGPIDPAEERWLPSSLEDSTRVFELAVDAGESASTAAGLAHWLTRLATGADEAVTGQTRWRYRNILRGLEDAGHGGPKSGRKMAARRGSTSRAMGVLLNSGEQRAA